MAEKVLTLADKKRKAAERELLAAINYGLEEAIQHAGGVVTGFSIKFGESDYLMTIRAIVSGNSSVAFVGAPSLRDLFRKAEHLAWTDGLAWKSDRYENGSG